MLKKRCIVRDAKYDLVDDACWKWFSQQRSKGAPVSGPLMQEKVLSFSRSSIQTLILRVSRRARAG